MGWFSKTPPSAEQQLEGLTNQTQNLPENLRPDQPDISALGGAARSKSDISNELKAMQNVTGGGGSKKPPQEVKYSGIDYTGLERAAKSARELDGSSHAKEAVELAMEGEKTKRVEAEAQIKQYEVAIKQAEHQHTRIKGEEERKTQSERMHLQKEHSKFEDQLARRRDQDRMDQEKQTQAEILRAQEESLQKQEHMRRETLKEEMRLRRENDVAAAEAAAAAKAKYDSLHHEKRLEQIKLESQEKRKGWVEVTQTAAGAVKDAVSTAFAPQNIGSTLAGITGLAVCIYGTQQGMKVMWKVVGSRLLEPVLVRKTNRISPGNIIKHPIKTAALWRANREAAKIDVASIVKERIVVNPKVFNHITDIAIGAQNTVQNGGYLRNVLLHGPPGTGKTLFAENLAAHANMNYAIISGGDVAPLGPLAVQEMLNLFDWAETGSKNGLILFIDEADAFLRKRNDKAGQMSESMRATVNAFLQRTGTPSKKVMVVLASNQPEQLDWAVSDRMDTSVHFPLPTITERLRLINLLYNKKIMDGVIAPTATGFSRFLPAYFKSSRKIDIDDEVLNSQQDILEDIGNKTEGLSGRQLDKMVTAWEHGMYADEDGKLTKSIMYDCLGQTISDHHTRMTWTDEFEATARTQSYTTPSADEKP